MRRRTLFAVVLGLGILLAVAGFALSAPIGPPESPRYSDPRVDFAPLIFVVGVILTFSSAVVYELVGD